MRIRKITRSAGKPGSKRETKTAPRAQATGMQQTGEGETSGFQPWLRDDETYLEITRLRRKGRDGRRSPEATEQALQSRGAEAARAQIERRAARVAELRARVASGSYSVDSVDVARSMLGLDRDQEQTSS